MLVHADLYRAFGYPIYWVAAQFAAGCGSVSPACDGEGERHIHATSCDAYSPLRFISGAMDMYVSIKYSNYIIVYFFQIFPLQVFESVLCQGLGGEWYLR